MTAVCLVAHPDDCVIFAWPFIEKHRHLDWTIVYVTYDTEHPRSKEASRYWNSKGISVRFLGFPDQWDAVKNHELGFDPELANDKITETLLDLEASLILTHNNDGDYGHPHHKFVSVCAGKMVIPKVYFASTFNYNTEYPVTEPVDILLWPLHRSVIEGFQDRNTGLYIVTDEAKKIL
jgi:LmbE family N-acetylglucosaminyl deacetylase